MNEADLDLIHGGIDGELAPDERERLRNLLEGDPEARKAYEELRVVAAQLESLPQADPPSHLWTDIMDALPERRQARQHGRGTIGNDLRRVVGLRAALAYACTFAAGLLVGIAALTLLRTGTPSEDDLHGFLMANEEVAGFNEAASRTELQLPDGGATIRVLSGSGAIIARVDARAEENAELRLLPGEGMALRGVTRQATDLLPSFEVTNSAVTLHVRGEAAFDVFFARPPGTQTLQIELWRGGTRVDSDTLVLGP